ncbi:DUF6328 family protein [Desertimonas flava]|uniref:DUF6328 family protein n=1 Tax=Desertimonas flava TaxID=2064846 RepID=UPI0013C4917A|nr:DUF6328 family protein [Desertimonas flava]
MRDADLRELDDLADRDELRRRYYGLLQELRVVLPGVQVLLAFLLTAPFTDRFEQLDDAGRAAYTVALAASLGAVVCLLTPTVFHRVALRTERTARLAWGVRLTLVGVSLLAVSLLAALWCVVRYVYGTAAGWVFTGAGAVLVISLWLVLPLTAGRAGTGGAATPPPGSEPGGRP